MGRISDSWSRLLGERASGETAGDPASSGRGRSPFQLSDAHAGFLKYLALLGAIGLLLMVFGKGDRPRPAQPAMQPTNATVVPVATGPADYAEELERELTAVLRLIQGVGNVEVMITLSAGVEQVLATEFSEERRVTEEADRNGGRRVISEERRTSRPILARDDDSRSERPVVLLERRPRIQSVLVVAEGARDSRIKLEIHRAVRTVLQIPDHRVYVAARRP